LFLPAATDPGGAGEGPEFTVKFPPVWYGVLKYARSTNWYVPGDGKLIGNAIVLEAFTVSSASRLGHANQDPEEFDAEVVDGTDWFTLEEKASSWTSVSLLVNRIWTLSPETVTVSGTIVLSELTRIRTWGALTDGTSKVVARVAEDGTGRTWAAAVEPRRMIRLRKSATEPADPRLMWTCRTIRSVTQRPPYIL
jgi:hypothetical protein